MSTKSPLNNAFLQPTKLFVLVKTRARKLGAALEEFKAEIALLKISNTTKKIPVLSLAKAN